MWAFAQRDGLSNIGGALCERNSIPCTTPQTLVDASARLPCSNAANLGKRKTWTQSEFCSWPNSVMGQQSPKMHT